MINKNNVIFLLGGHDLEMVTIKDILDQHDIKYFDESQKWGAKLSDYVKRLQKNSEKQFYAVELTVDDSVLLDTYNIEIIDHHNEYAHRDASILQILELLDIEPTYEYELVAANDAKYIKGMQCIDASDNEMKSIRQEDRKAQGISTSDEKAAENDVRSRKLIDDIIVVCATTPHFSAITDSLYFDVKDNERESKTIIYNDTTMVFYGFLLDDMKKLLKDENVDSNAYYFGGGDKGFIGIKNNALDKEKMTILKEQCIKENKKKINSDIYSYHTFMLPFRFDKITEDITSSSTYDYYQKVDLSKRISIDEAMMELLKEDKWEHKPFKIESASDYNEYAYFYSYIRETLYNKEEFSQNKTSYFFEKEYKGGNYTIKIKDRNYELALEGLSLRIFETGIAIFSIEVSNRKYSQSKIDDILKINEYGRRIYAPFLARFEDKENWTQAPKGSQLAESVKVTLADGTVCEDNFCTEYIDIPNDIKISPYILKLLGLHTFTTQREHKNQYLIQPIIDDRMFVLSWYGDDVCSESLKNHNYIKNNKWYEYVFIDGGGITVHNNKMQDELIKNSTYDRWMDYQYGLTLFGLSRYSFVCLSNASSYSKDVLPLPHMKTMYFQMFTLLLATRASTLRFSEEVTALSNIKNEDNFSEKVSILYKYYIKFVNKIYFREITAQEQGIELYNKASELMNIERDVKDLDDEIAELYTYVSMKAEEKQVTQAQEREERLETISKLGAVFLPPALLSGIFGINSASYMNDNFSIVVSLFAIFISAVLGFAMVTIKDKKTFIFFLTSLSLLFTMFAVPFFLKKEPIIKQMQTVKVESPIECVIKKDKPIKIIPKEKKENNKTK